jgi:N-acetylglucosamine-6-phosphate deacetylase
MIVLSGGSVVLPDRVQEGGSVIVDGDRIAAVESAAVAPAGAQVIDAAGCFIVPGFIDVHVHGVEGLDTLDGGTVVSDIANKLPRYGVTAFCPTSVACGPDDLETFLGQVRSVGHPFTGAAATASASVGRPFRGARGSARVLPAHLESNFINPEFRGAQPLKCLRSPDEHRGAVAWPFTGPQILDIIENAGPAVGIVTLAPELPGGIDLVRALTSAGRIVSLGHSGADFDTAVAAIEAGARHATHLFNRMTPLTHRAPGVAGAVLARHEVVAELICDGYHVHPSMCGVAIAAKGPSRVMAITDGTSGSGLPLGSICSLGGQAIHVRDSAAFLDDGTLAGSTLTMDRAFRNLVTVLGQSVVDAVAMCSTTPARQLGLSELGRIVEGAEADLVMVDREFHVVRTFVAGQQVWVNTARTGSV